MKLLLLSKDHPIQNLAFEEWYFQSFKEDTLRIWVNGPSVIVGKHQNAYAECNTRYCLNQDIPVLRRISGGGTVYHDDGNLNLSFFRFSKTGQAIAYEENLQIVIHALRKIGVHLTLNERHDLCLENHKVSGSAQHVSRGRSLHHATILFDANLHQLSNSLKRTSGIFTDKAVKSVRSSVTNIKPKTHFQTMTEFVHSFCSHLNLDELDLIENDEAVRHLAQSRYSMEEWNFGYGPAYIFENQNGPYGIRMEVARGGIIEQLDLTGMPVEKVNPLKGIVHQHNAIKNALNHASYSSDEKEIILNLMF